MRLRCRLRCCRPRAKRREERRVRECSLQYCDELAHQGAGLTRAERLRLIAESDTDTNQLHLEDDGLARAIAGCVALCETLVFCENWREIGLNVLGSIFAKVARTASADIAVAEVVVPFYVACRNVRDDHWYHARKGRAGLSLLAHVTLIERIAVLSPSNPA